MEIKKNPKSNLENYSKLFMQLGLVLALFVTYVAIENKTYDKTVFFFDNNNQYYLCLIKLEIFLYLDLLEE